jgi:hypothetical protein
MTIPLARYYKWHSQHMFSSETFCKKFSDIVAIERIQLSTNFVSDTYTQTFLFYYFLTKKKGSSKWYYYAYPEDHSQRIVLTHHVLELDLGVKVFNNIFKYAFNNVFRDYLKRPKKNSVIVLPSNIIMLTMHEFPFLFYNKSLSFKNVFFNFNQQSHYNLKFAVKINTTSFPKTFFLMEHHKYINRTTLE